MSNLWFLWFLQECHRNSWELKLVIVHFRQPRIESLALGCLDFDASLYTRSRESILKPGASQLVYRAAAFTMEQASPRRIRVGAVRH
jgi:hypothetical protein